MDRPFFSIVMPAYQAEKYLGNAIEGILAQSFSDWELLVVEDCSKDKTLEIAQKFQSADKRIKVIHREKNAGVSEARNLGIEKARGEYLWFTDADDKAEGDLLEKVHNSLQKNRAQLVVFGLVEEYYSNGQLHKEYNLKDGIPEGDGKEYYRSGRLYATFTFKDESTQNLTFYYDEPDPILIYSLTGLAMFILGFALTLILAYKGKNNQQHIKKQP